MLAPINLKDTRGLKVFSARSHRKLFNIIKSSPLRVQSIFPYHANDVKMDGIPKHGTEWQVLTGRTSTAS